jgi:hypothetical protein
MTMPRGPMTWGDPQSAFIVVTSQPSSVTTVHPSGSNSTAARPALIIRLERERHTGAEPQPAAPRRDVRYVRGEAFVSELTGLRTAARRVLAHPRVDVGGGDAARNFAPTCASVAAATAPARRNLTTSAALKISTLMLSTMKRA